MILYHKSNLVYTVVSPQFLIFQQNNSAQASVLSPHYYFLEKLKIREKQLCKLNCSYGKVSHALKLKTNVFFKVAEYFCAWLTFACAFERKSCVPSQQTAPFTWCNWKFSDSRSVSVECHLCLKIKRQIGDSRQNSVFFNLKVKFSSSKI